MIDTIVLNYSRTLKASGTLAPLVNEDGVRSKHRVAYASTELLRNETFKWGTYSYWHFSKESVIRFKEWIVLHPGLERSPGGHWQQ